MSRLFLRVWLVLSAVVLLTAFVVLFAARPPPFPVFVRPPPPWTRPEVWGSLAALWALGAMLVHGLLRPLREEVRRLQAASRQLASGEWGARASLGDGTTLGDVGRSLDDLAHRVGELNVARDELLRNVSHELRTPISRVAFAVDLLSTDVDALSRRRRGEAIAADLAELEDLVAELLAWSSIDSRPKASTLAPIEPGPILEKLVDDARLSGPYSGLASRERDVSIEMGPLPSILADGRGIQRAIGNLVRNASRYAAMRVRVRASVRDDALVIDVEDDGPGVGPADRERIFEPFVRLDPARSRDTGGTGLGLALSRRILRAHGGDVVCTESELGGARFTARLPIGRPAA